MKTRANLFRWLCFLFICRMSTSLSAQELSSRWRNAPIGGGGRTVGFIGSPSSDMLYLRTDVAGMYKKRPSDAQWTRLTETFDPDYGERMIGCAGLGVHPTDDNILYAALSKGIYKSTNQGRTWSKKLNVRVWPNGKKDGGNDRNYGEALVVDQRDGDVVYYGSQDDGLFYTRNGGNSWTQIPNDQLPDKGSRSIVVDNLRATMSDGRAQYIYVSVRNEGLYRSTNGGTSFSQWRATLPGGGKTVRWLRQSKQGDLYAAHEKGLARWRNNQWQDVSPFPGVEVTALATDPQDNDQVLCFVYWSSSDTGDMYRSTNRGDSWEIVPYSVGDLPPWAAALNRYEPGQKRTFALYFDDQSESTNNRAYVCSNYYPWQTNNIWANTVTWDAMYQGNEMTINITGVSLPTGAPYIAGMADVRGFKYDDITAYPGGRLSIAQDDANDGFFTPNFTSIDYCESDPSTLWFAASKPENGRQDFVGQVYRSTNGGDNLRYVANPWAGTDWERNAGGPKLAVSATNANKVVAMARNSVRYTTDGGTTWNNSGGVNRTSGLLERNIEYEFDQLIKSDRVNGNKFYVYATDGRFFKSTNAGASFGLVSTAGLPARDWIKGDNSSTGGGVHMAVAPGLEEEVWLALGSSGIWRASGNANKTNRFTEVTYFAQDNPTAVTFGKAAPGSSTPAVYVFAKRQSDNQWGIWKSDDLGSTWQLASPEDQPGQWPRLLVGDQQTYGRVYMGNASYGIQYLTVDNNAAFSPNPNKWYYLQSKSCKSSGLAKRLKADNCSDISLKPSGTTNRWKWRFELSSDGQSYYIINRSCGHRLASVNCTLVEGASGGDGVNYRWKVKLSADKQYFYLEHPECNKRLDIDNCSSVDLGTGTSNSKRWKLVEANDYNGRTATNLDKNQSDVGREDWAIGEIRVFPNPASGQLYLRKKASVRVEGLTLFDMLGKRCALGNLSDNKETMEISIDNLRPGIYTLQGTADQRPFTSRIVIRR